jgi:EmrB/QacA subfamily drug resistance transporter
MKRDDFVTDKRRQFLLIISVAFSSFLAGLNNYIVNVSLPTIADYFNTGTSEVSRVVLAYLLIITSSLLLFGRLGDRIGLKKVFVTGYFVFTAGSLLCGLAQGINMLIGFRLVQGIGSAMLLSSGYAIIARFLPPDRMGRAFGITGTSVALGIATGAPLGGFITGYLSWHWIFLANVPIGIVAIIAAGRCIPETGGKSVPERKGENFDIPGAVLSFLGLALFLYGLNTGKMIGWTSPSILVSFALAITLLSVFVARERKCTSPLLDFRLFKNLTLTYALLSTFMAFMLLAANAFLLPFYLQTIKHLNAQQTGMVLLLYSLVHVLVTPYAGRLSDRMSPYKLCAVGMVSGSASAFFFSYTLGINGLGLVFVFLLWFAVSYAFFLAPNINRVMSLASSGGHGSASGLLTTTANLSMIFGVAIFETVFSQGFSGMLPRGVSIFHADIPAQLLVRGFSHAYILGGVVCLLSFLFSLAGKEGEK